ncbi:hypothetical protein E1750_07245 [Flavobacterium nackdongense]|uniref:Uncharacterized protein n=1 Tax=Flavobacterium nackdongense TaxID=2547394 RepID=A0A4P6YE27_9FLAO|nr:hypothetical protein E1750_07245 [Flavobacterium nackdongense]
MLLKPVLPVLDYVVNYEYITKVLCVNKAKPKLQCNGKCHLMKELAKASDPEASGEKPISSDKKTMIQESEVLFYEEINSFTLTAIYCDKKQHATANYSNSYSYLSSVSVFRPPIFIS